MSISNRTRLPDAHALLERIQDGSTTATDTVREHLDRIDALHSRLNAATEVLREEALAQAERPVDGPLSGLPITLKETFALQGRQITAGSVRMPPIDCSNDAPVVRRLKDAGAIVIARSNVPEFVMLPETNNLRFGRTNNPIDPSRVAGGSTGGEGALVGSGCSPVGMGTDILGSIRIPAACCAVVGFRPASGLVDKTDVWTSGTGFFETWNGIGPLTRSVRDARLIYNVIAEKPLPEPEPIEGLRLISPMDFPSRIRESVIMGALQMARRRMIQDGMRNEEHRFADVARLFSNIPRIVCSEAVPQWKEWLRDADGNPFRSRDELLRQLLRRPGVETNFFVWFAMEPLMRTGSPQALARLVQDYQRAREHYYAMLGDDGILLLPTLGLLAPTHGGMNRTCMRPGLNRLITPHTFCNYINLSAISVPAWQQRDPHSGMVPSMMLACRPGAEGRLLDVAAVIEQALN